MNTVTALARLFDMEVLKCLTGENIKANSRKFETARLKNLGPARINKFNDESS
jgi:hypothetical protein